MPFLNQKTDDFYIFRFLECNSEIIAADPAQKVIYFFKI
jgi:hypothetical protein